MILAISGFLKKAALSFVYFLALSGCAETGVAQTVDQMVLHPLDRKISDLTFSGQLRMGDVERRWGESVEFGPGKVMRVYIIENYDEVWLSYADEEPNLLLRAVHVNSSNRESTILFDGMIRTKSRSCEDLVKNEIVDAEVVYKNWGPPDGNVGSGFIYWVYNMKDGGQTLIDFDRSGRIRNISGC